MHEAQFWKTSSFITLTYKETPRNNSLSPEDARNFIRRLRDEISAPFKYYLVGEYGDKGDRPHYHALIFGYDFGLYKNKESVTPELYNTTAIKSRELDTIWGLGHTSVGHLTYDSAAYCAQYAMKKINGPKSEQHYGLREKEFMRQSQDAIGKQYALKYAQEIINNNAVYANNIKHPIPRYYLKLYEKNNYDLTNLKITREEFSSTHSLEKSYVRAVKLDQKFKFKVSKTDTFRIRYLKKDFFDQSGN